MYKIHVVKETTSSWDRKHSGKMRNCSSQAISPFPTVFSKYMYLFCRHVKSKACLGKGQK